MTRLGRGAVAAFGLLAFGLFFYQAISRLVTYHHHTYDLALYARQAWGLARLNFWNPILDQSFLTSHWSFVLLPLGLIGRLYGTSEALLLCQSLAMAVTAWPLARFAARRGGDAMGILAAAVFLLYPNICHVACYEFHPGNLALPALAWALDALDRRDARTLWVCVGWILLCRADFALATLMLALLARAAGPPLAAVFPRLAGLSLGYFAIVVLIQSVASRPGLVTSADLHFGAWGSNPAGFLIAPFTKPAVFWDHVTDGERLGYPIRLLLPLLGLPLLGLRHALPALPFLAINLVSVFPTTTHLDSHYLTPAVPALVCAAVEGLARLRGRLRAVAGVGLFASALASSLLVGGAPWSRDYVFQDFHYDHPSFHFGWLRRAIPDGVSVQAPDPLLPHLAERTWVYRAPPPERNAEYVVVDTRHRMRFLGDESLIRTTEEPIARNWLARTDYAIVEATPTGLVFARADSPLSQFTKRYFIGGMPGPTTRIAACLAIHSARFSSDTLRLFLRASGSCPPDLALRIGTAARPEHVRLLFDGYFSPVHLRAGDWVASSHTLPRKLAARIRAAGLRVGALRSSGARPEHADPVSVPVPLKR